MGYLLLVNDDFPFSLGLISVHKCLYIEGASISNMYGAILARFSKFPEVKTKGLTSIGTLVAFTSEEVVFSTLVLFS